MSLSDQPLADHIFEALDRFGALVRDTGAPECLVQAFCQQLVTTTSGADMAGVAVVSEQGTKLQTVACTDPRVLDIELHQYQLDEGPGVESACTGQRVRVNSGDVASRWPDFARCAESVGVSSYFSVPLSIDEVQVGVLSLYSFVDHGFAEIDEVLLQVCIAAVEGAVWKARRKEEWRVEIAGVRAAMKSRGHIEQAKGDADSRARDHRGPSIRDVGSSIAAQDIRVTAVAAAIIRALRGQSGTGLRDT